MIFWLSMTIPSIFTAVLTGLVSFALSYYSQNKSKRDVVNAIFAETKMKFEDNKNRNLLQIKYIVEVIKFIVQSILFAILLMIIYRFLQTINSSSASACIITALIIYGLCYNIFSAILFSIFRLLLLAREIKKGGETWHHYPYIFIISFSPTTSDIWWGIIFYLSFSAYLYVTLYKLEILSNIIVIFSLITTGLIALVLVLTPYISFALARRLQIIIPPEELDRIFFFRNIKSDEDKRKSDKNRHEEMHILEHMFESIDSLIFWMNPDKPKIRVRVGSTVYEGEVKEIGRNLVIVSTDKQSNVIVSHIRWEKIDAVEVIK